MRSNSPPPPFPDLKAFMGVHVQAWIDRGPGRRQQDFVDLLGLDKGFVSKIIGGRARFGLASDGIVKACRILDLSAEEARELYRLCGLDMEPILGAGDGGAAAGA